MSGAGGGDERELTRRRAVLAAGVGSLGTLGLAGAMAAAGQDGEPTSAGGSTSGDGAPGTTTARRLPFAGTHQAGIAATPTARMAAMAAFRVTADDRDELAAMFTDLSASIAALMSGEMPPERDPAYPPLETGIVGATLAPDNLSVVVSVGASLFDDRFGLAGRRPTQLEKMPFLANDRLDPERSHGDLLLSIEADHTDTVQHALRQMMRATRGSLVLAWTLDGYARGISGGGEQTPRNLLGFKDGTNNLDADDEALLDRHVWVGADDGEPAWAVGGSYHVVRVIRMLVEFWDRTRLAEQEAIFGRHKVSGAPLGAEDEFAEVDLSSDPDGEVIPLDAHIRLANPRTPETADDLMLRRGFSYTRGVDGAGQLDQGLAFVSYQRELDRFLRVQERLDGEPLEEYIRPEGGGFYFALPAPPDAETSIAHRLLG